MAPREVYDDGYFTAYRGGDYFATETLRRHEARVRLALVRRHSGAEATTMVEIGSAAGYFLDEATKAGWRAVGVEPARSVAEQARRRLGVEIQVAFVEDASLPPGAFDAACLWHTVEHIPDPIGPLGAVGRALRPGGRLFLEVPNAASLLAKRHEDAWFPLEPDVHVAQWTPESIGNLLRRAGFELETIDTVPFLTYVAGAAHRLPRRALLALRQRRWLTDPHPWGHELLRAIARRPAA